jgi:hypothetical protein
MKNMFTTFIIGMILLNALVIDRLDHCKLYMQYMLDPPIWLYIYYYIKLIVEGLSQDVV